MSYVFQHTDPANGSFIVQPFQIDGTQHPWSPAMYVNSASGATAVTANTSLVFAGKGISEYGELIQHNLVYLTENFSYKSRPLAPMQGQLWYKNAAYTDPNYPSDPTNVGMYLWNGGSWASLMMATSGVLNLAGNRITDVGNATQSTDALNLQTGDSRYLRTSGGTINGDVDWVSGSVAIGPSASITIANQPTSADQAVNKSYVDQQVGSLNSSIALEASTRQSADASLSADITAATNTINSRLLKSGDVMTGPLMFDAAAELLIADGGGSLNFGNRRLQLVGTPSANTDATTKLYVDSAISAAVAGITPGGTTDGVVDAGVFNEDTGVLTLSRVGMGDIIVSGNMAAQNHTHNSTAITYDMTTPYPRSIIATNADGVAGYPAIPLYTAVQILDQSMSELYRSVHRALMSGDGVTTTFALPEAYIVGSNRLQIFVDGLKQYCSERGVAVIKFSDASPLAIDTQVAGLFPGTYGFNISLNGAAATQITLTLATRPTYGELLLAIDAGLSAAGIPVAVTLEQRRTFLETHLTSSVYGPTSSVVISAPSTGADLFAAITTLTELSSTTSAPKSLAYQEVGATGDTSSSVVFTTAPAINTLIEFLIYPGV